jgi:uncharacterized protein
VQNPRHYLCPTEEAPDRRRLVVRDGDLLIGYPAKAREAMSPEEIDALRREEVVWGAGIERGGSGLEWRATVSGFGYLEFDERDVPRVVPAITIDSARLAAHLDLRQATGDEAPIQVPEIYAALRATGVCHGLSVRHVQAAWRLFQKSGSLASPLRIASGTVPIKARKGEVVWEIEVGQSTGSVNAVHGQIDFHERQYVQSVRAGQRLGVWKGAMNPEPGIGVDGEEIGIAEKPPPPLKLGAGLVAEEKEPGLTLILVAIDGMFIVDTNGAPSVVDQLEIPGDVDLETGNIDARGSVVVRGSVRPEFHVKTTGDLTIRGMIEAASLTVGGNLVVEKGILGAEGESIIVKGDVTARYCQNADIRCGGSVKLLDSDTNSVIRCEGELQAVDGRGRLRGGEYSAREGISTRELGSELGAPTKASVGGDGTIESDLKTLRGKLMDVRARMRMGRRTEPPLSRKVTGRGKSDFCRKRPKIARDLARQEAALRAKLRRLEKQCGGGGEGVALTVLGAVYIGVEITVQGRILCIPGSITGRRFILDPQTLSIDAQLL